MSRTPLRDAGPRRRVHPLAVVAVGLAVLVVASLVIARMGDRPAPSGTSGDYPVVAVGPEDGVPPPGPQHAAVDLVWPIDLTWTTVAGLDLPVSRQAGPRDLAGGLAKGFSQTPAGAVLAALHLVVRTSPQVGPQVWGPTLREQVVGPDTAAYADAVEQGYETAREQLQISYGEPLGRIYASIRGVRVDAYSPQAASLRLLIEAPGGDGGLARAAAVVQVSWSGTDWQLIAPPRGDWATVRVLVPAEVARAYTPLPGR